MKQIMEKIINSGDLLWEELFYISLGKELGIRKALGAAAESYFNIYKKGVGDAFVAIAPAVKEAIGDAYSLGSSAIGPTDVSTDKIIVTDLDKISTEPLPNPKVTQELLLNSNADNFKINVVAGVKNVIVEGEKELAFNNVEEIDEYVSNLAETDITSIKNMGDLEKEKFKINKTIEALYKYRRKPGISSEDIEIVDYNLDLLNNGIIEIENRIYKLSKTKTSGVKKSKKTSSESSQKDESVKELIKDIVQGESGVSTPESISKEVEKNENISISPPTPGEQEMLEKLEKEREPKKHLPKKTVARRATSTPDLSDITKRILEKYTTPSPLTDEERQRIEKLKEQYEKDNKKEKTKPVARKLRFEQEEPTPAKIPIKIKLPTKGEKGLYKATLKDTSPNTKDIEFEFDDWTDVDKYLRKFEGTKTNRYLRSGVITQGKVSQSISTGKGFYIDFSNAEYMPIKDGSRLSKKLTIDDSKPQKSANIEFRLNK